MYLFYTFGLAGGFTLGLPYFLYKFCTTDKYRGGIKERFGFLPPSLLTMLSGRRPLWIHGVSVGEITAVTPLVTALQEHYPALPLLVSTGTVTGQQTARKQLPTVRHFCYFPLDFPWVVRRVVDRLQPRGVILVETEIWPNFLRYLARHQIPVLLVNGRISPRSFRGYRWIAPFMRRVLADMTFCSMQTVQDAERLLALGADPDKVAITGNIKFDQVFASLSRREKPDFLPPSWQGKMLFIAGSTHPGEEEQIMTLYQRIRGDFPSLRLIIAPRHVERAAEVVSLVQKHGLRAVRRTELTGQPLEASQESSSVLILDTIGELSALYQAGTLIFVGGSLVPIGGHNILEALIYKKPVLYGPHMHNFHEIAALVEAKDGGRRVQDLNELEQAVRKLLSDPQGRERMGERGYQVIEENRGAVSRNLSLIRRYLLSGFTDASLR